MAGFRLEKDAAAKAFNAFLNNGETDTCSGVITVGVKPLEHVEDTFLVDFGNADAVILYREEDVILQFRGRNTNLWGDAGADVLQSVGNEISEYLFQDPGVTPDEGKRPNDLHGGGFDDNLLGVLLKNRVEHLADINRFHGEFGVTQASVGEEIIDQQVHPVTGLNHTPDIILLFVIKAGFMSLDEHFNKAADGANGSAEVVGDVITYTGEGLDGAFEAGGTLGYLVLQIFRIMTEDFMGVLEQTFGGLGFRNIPGNFGCADDHAVDIFYGRNGQGNVNEAAIFGKPHGFEVFDAFTAPQFLEDLTFLLNSIGWKDDGNGFAKDFFGVIPQKTLGTQVPTGDDAVEIFADDCIIG